MSPLVLFFARQHKERFGSHSHVPSCSCWRHCASPASALAKDSSFLIKGADVTRAQQEAVIADLNLSSRELKAAKRIVVTNGEEHERCDKSIPKSVTGNKTLSCDYLKLAKGGGLKVKVRNLTYVTKDSLRNALQTAGVKNCELVVTAPVKVSGTGALTGVFKACKKINANMDSKKEDAAVWELLEMSGYEQKYGDGFAQMINSRVLGIETTPSVTRSRRPALQSTI